LESGKKAQSLPVNVSKSAVTSILPTMAIGVDGTIHIAWWEVRGEGVMVIVYSSSRDGANWSRPYDVSDGRLSSMFPSIAVDPKGVVHLVWMQKQDQGFDVLYSSLSEGSWSPPENISNSEGISQRPKIVTDSKGKTHVLWYDNRRGSFVLYHSWRTGEKWHRPKNAGLVEWFITDDPEFGLAAGLAVDSNDNLHVVWTDIYDGKQDVFHSSWNGTVWEKPKNISLKGKSPREHFICTEASGNSHVSWVDEDVVWYTHSEDKTWAIPREMNDKVKANLLPSLFSDQSGGMHLAWSGEFSGNKQLLYRHFDGKSWSNLSRLTDARGQPFGVSILGTSPGKLHVAWVNAVDGIDQIFYQQGSPSELIKSRLVER